MMEVVIVMVVRGGGDSDGGGSGGNGGDGGAGGGSGDGVKGREAMEVVGMVIEIEVRMMEMEMEVMEEEVVMMLEVEEAEVVELLTECLVHTLAGQPRSTGCYGYLTVALTVVVGDLGLDLGLRRGQDLERVASVLKSHGVSLAPGGLQLREK
ncbi:hypothetical protein H920_11809 [Fukomys damarensis]|uniref:Uncharacterized protein n=1 Tax=Fukomys damarensis TaxID=885580 RepID=A0A091D3Z0_FUKDA|nr:hypothetical protein H920_11809 [Fukomys damarensis]